MAQSQQRAPAPSTPAKGAPAAPETTAPSVQPKGNAAAVTQLQAPAQLPATTKEATPGKAAESEGGVSGWLGRAGAAISEKVGAAKDAVAGAWQSVRGAAGRVADLWSDSAAGYKDGKLTAETDLDTIAPMLPAEWQASLGKGPADPKANRVKVALDTTTDQLFVSVPDLRLSGLSLGGFKAGNVAVSGLTLRVENAGSMGRDLVTRELTPSFFGSPASAPITSKAVHLSAASLHAEDVVGPGGVSLGGIDATGLEMQVDAADGLGKAGGSPKGVTGSFTLAAVTVRDAKGGGMKAGELSATKLGASIDPAREQARVTAATVAAQKLQVGGTKLGDGRIRNLAAEADLDGDSPARSTWDLAVDAKKATAHATADGASITHLAAGPVTVGAATASGLAVDQRSGTLDVRSATLDGTAGKVGSTTVVDQASAQGLATTTRFGAKGGPSGTVSASTASAKGVRAPGVTAGEARVDDGAVSWGATGTTTTAREASAAKVAADVGGTKVQAGSVAATDAKVSVGSGGVRADAAKLGATGVGVNVPGTTSTKQAAPAGATQGSGPKVDPAAVAGLVRDANVQASLPLRAGDYGGTFGATILPDTTATASVAVKDGKIVPSATSAKLSKPADLPAWVEGNGAYLEAGKGGTARVRADLAGAPDIDVTDRIPGLEKGVPLDVKALTSKVTAPSTSAPASPGGSAAATTPSPVDLSKLAVHGDVSLAGKADLAGVSGTLAGERAGDNRAHVDLAPDASGKQNLAVDFVRLLIGSLRVNLGGVDASAKKAQASSGAVSVVPSSGAASGRIGSVELEGVTAKVPDKKA